MGISYRSAIVSFLFLISWCPCWFCDHSTQWMPSLCFGPREGFWKVGFHKFRGQWSQLQFIWHVKNLNWWRTSNVLCKSFSKAKHWDKSHRWGTCTCLSSQLAAPFLSHVTSGKTLLALTWLGCLSCYKLSLSCLKYHFRQQSQLSQVKAVSVFPPPSPPISPLPSCPMSSPSSPPISLPLSHPVSLPVSLLPSTISKALTMSNDTNLPPMTMTNSNHPIHSGKWPGSSLVDPP